MSLTVGLTGPSGAGKSSIKSVAENLGFKVIDCDICAREAVEKGTDGLNALKKAFGKEILNSNSELDRAKLAKIAFSTKENTKLLNKTLLPYIVLIIREKMTGDYILLDAPTLFESGLDKECDKTLAVLSDKEIRLKRIMQRDGISKEAAVLRLNAGKTDDFYIKNADNIIYNNSRIESFLSETEEILKSYMKGI